MIATVAMSDHSGVSYLVSLCRRLMRWRLCGATMASYIQGDLSEWPSSGYSSVRTVQCMHTVLSAIKPDPCFPYSKSLLPGSLCG